MSPDMNTCLFSLICFEHKLCLGMRNLTCSRNWQSCLQSWMSRLGKGDYDQHLPTQVNMKDLNSQMNEITNLRDLTETDRPPALKSVCFHSRPKHHHKFHNKFKSSKKKKKKKNGNREWRWERLRNLSPLHEYRLHFSLQELFQYERHWWHPGILSLPNNHILDWESW